MKLNIGCGKQTWDDFYCIDAVPHSKASREPDLLFAFIFNTDGTLFDPVPLDDGVASELHCYHFIEHVFAWEAPHVMAEFYRLMAPGAKLVLELPDLALACRNLLKGHKDQLSMWPLYGDPGTKDPYMCHKYGYTPRTIRELVEGAGFQSVAILPPTTHGARLNRDMRVEAVK